MSQQEFYELLDKNSVQPHAQPADTFYHAFSSAMVDLSRLEDGRDVSNTTIAQKGNTDFKRRKNWSERILVEITGLLHVLSPNGDLLYCSESTFELTGYRPHELVGQKLMEFLHVDDLDVFIRDFQLSFRTRSQIKSCYRFRKRDDSYVIFDVVGQPNIGAHDQPPQAFFGIAQPVPTKNGAMIDTFLELKTENNWLRRRVDELSAKYGTVPVDHTKNEMEREYGLGMVTELLTGNIIHDNDQNNPASFTKEPKAWLDENTSKELENTVCDSRKENLVNKILDKKTNWKRRNMEADEYVCKDCGTTSSPEWRKGPQGPKTLCNACGLRWAKKNKKRNFNED